MSKLYIVATPIGNLEDITKRALRTLSEVDLILSEDTRETKKLLDRYEIKKPLLSYHQHSELKKTKEIADLLKKGKDLALVSDAGTPCISDPGSKLIESLLKERVEIIPVPGPSALLAAAAASGFPMDKFVFLGFPPVKKKRDKFFREMAEYSLPVILYESPYRMVKTLEDLKKVVPGKDCVVFREITKKFETVYRGSVEKVENDIRKEGAKGEFVVVLSGKK